MSCMHLSVNKKNILVLMNMMRMSYVIKIISKKILKKSTTPVVATIFYDSIHNCFMKREHKNLFVKNVAILETRINISDNVIVELKRDIMGKLQKHH